MNKDPYEGWNQEMPTSADFAKDERTREKEKDLLILYWDPRDGGYVCRNDNEDTFHSTLKKTPLLFVCWKNYTWRSVHLPGITNGHETYINLDWIQGRDKSYVD